MNKKITLSGKIFLLATSIGATLWFLLRVIPKPSRATYPCMRAAAPFMSGLIIYIVSLLGSIFAFKKAKETFLLAKYWKSFLFGFVALIAITIFYANDIQNAFAGTKQKYAVLEASNTPIGTPKGYFPGRVVWVMDQDATNDLGAGDKWYNNTNQEIVSRMLADGIKKYANTSDLKTAWNCLFGYFNNNHGKGWVGYTAGEKIMIKLNHTNLGAGGHDMSELMNSTPEMVLALLTQLVDVVGVAQADITIGDPYRGFPDVTYDICHAKYPNIHYIEGIGTEGREKTIIAAGDVFFTSDGSFKSRLPKAYMEASYLINMPCLKTHDSAGISLAAKNHQGSVIGDDQNATNQYMGNYLHYDYPSEKENQVMGIYRHIVDYMAHSKLGGNTLVYIVDAIWSGRNWNGFVDKFGMAPFDDDYTSSIFISQDAVAIESVGFDFLYNEYDNFGSNHEKDDFPLWEGVQDYIHQAADPANWPSGISYDPDDKDQSHPVGSLGVHEHWNNATDKKYSVNITGNKGGIELVSVPSTLVGAVPLNYTHEGPELAVKEINVASLKLFPNPAKDQLKVSYNLNENSNIAIALYSLDGKLTTTLLNAQLRAGYQSKEFNLNVPKGMYILKLTSSSNGKSIISSSKLEVR